MLKTEFLGLNYHPNPATNTDEVDAEKYFNENYFTIDANAKEMREKVNYLSAQMPWNTLQGESIHIQDASLWDENKLEISGNMKQEKRSGKNKFKLPESATSNGITYTNNGDGTFNLSGTATAQANFLIPVKNSFVEGKSYTVSSNQSIGAVRYYIHNCTSTGAWKKTQLDFTSETAKTKVFGESTTDYISCNIIVVTGATLNLTNVNVQVEEGTVATDWEQYGAMPSTEFPSMPVVATGVQKIRQFGKNVCKITSVTGYTYTGGIPTAVGDITINKFDTNNLTITSVANAYRIALTNIIQLLPNTTYTLSYTRTNNLVGGSARRYIYNYSEADGYTLINALNSGDDGKMSYTFTTGESGAIALAWGYNNTASGSSSVISDIQIEKGSVATENESCNSEDTTLDLGTTELCAIKDANGTVVAQDRPVYRNGKWQWEKNVGKYAFKGTENFDLWGNGTDSAYRMIYKGLISTIKKNGLILSNYYSTKLATQLYDFEAGIATDANGNIIIHDNDFTTTDSYKANLVQKYANGTPLTVYYPLATSEYEDCTTDQSAVLDKLYNNFKLQKGVNNIIVETDNGVGVNMELTYMQDNVLRHDKDITELKQAIVALGGVI